MPDIYEYRGQEDRHFLSDLMRFTFWLSDIENNNLTHYNTTNNISDKDMGYDKK